LVTARSDGLVFVLEEITVSPCEVVSFEMAILLEVADHGFGPTSSVHFSVHFSADGW
jgi:hypothetical protein